MESVIIKVLIGAIITGIFGLNVKIVWDWLSRASKNYEMMDKFESRITAIESVCSDRCKNNESVRIAMFGNGVPENSVVYRLASLEEHVKTIQESRDI